MTQRKITSAVTEKLLRCVQYSLRPPHVVSILSEVVSVLVYLG